MTVDVIIATRDRNAGIQRTLASLSDQEIRPNRIIVVDDGSATPVSPPDAVGGTEVLVIRHRVSKGPGEARNRAASASTSKYLAFIDDDVVVEPSWLKAHMDTIAMSPNTVSIGPLLAPPAWRPTAWNRWEAATLAAEYERMKRGEYRPTFRQFFTGNALVPRDLFFKAGGFDSRFKRAEDIELGIRLNAAGAAFAFAPGARGWHYARRTLSSWRSIPRQYAFYDAVIDKLHRPGWLSMLAEERVSRSRVNDMVLRIAARPVIGTPIVTASLWTGIALSRWPTMRLGQKLLTLAWLSEYRRELGGCTDDPAMEPIRAAFEGLDLFH